MNVSELIESLEYLISDDCTETQLDYYEEILQVINILKKWIEVKPVKVSDSFDGEEIMICPECTALIKDGAWFAKICPNCGQKIKW